MANKVRPVIELGSQNMGGLFEIVHRGQLWNDR